MVVAKPGIARLAPGPARPGRGPPRPGCQCHGFMIRTVSGVRPPRVSEPQADSARRRPGDSEAQGPAPGRRLLRESLRAAAGPP